MFRRLPLILLLLTTHLCVFAKEAESINVRQLSTEYGIMHYGVTALYQDESGFIWIGSKEGLSRFDGTKNRIFLHTHSSPDDLIDNNVRNICGDGRGHLFIRGNMTASVFDLKTYRFKMLFRNGVVAICYANGYLWIAFPHSLSRYDPSDGSLSDYFSFEDSAHPGAYISTLFVDDGGRVHIGTTNEGYFRIDGRAAIDRHVNMHESNHITGGTDGEIWVSTRSQGLFRIGVGGEVKRYVAGSGPGGLNHNNVRQVVQRDSTTYYVGTLGGLMVLDAATGLFTHYDYDRQSDAHNSRSVVTMLLDRQGTLWFGTYFNGVLCYNPEFDNFRYYRPSNDRPGTLSSSIINAVAEDSRGHIWMATEGGGLNRLDPDRGAFAVLRKSRDGISEDIVKSLYYDEAADRLWAATLNNGIDRLDLPTGRISTAKVVVSVGKEGTAEARNIVSIVPWGPDSLLLATNKGAVVLCKESMWMRTLEVNYASTRRLQVWDIVVQDERTVWLTTSSGLYRYDPSEGSTKRYMFRDIVGFGVNNHMNYMEKDPAGNVWFGSTGSGLFRYNAGDDSFTRYTTADGLASDYVTGIREYPGNGDLLVSTLNGLSRLNPATGKITTYNSANGYPFGVITEQSLFIASRGELYAGGFGGAVSVPVEKLDIRRRDYRLGVSDIYVDNTRVAPMDSLGVLQVSSLFQEKIVLKPRHSVISFELFDDDFANLSRSNIEYKLEGFDPGFVPAGTGNTATYTNLNPGRYTFVARGSQPDSRGNHPETSLEIIVRPPFYKSAWFVVFCILAFLGIAAYLLHAYTVRLKLRNSIENAEKEKQHVEELNQSKFRFFTNITHEFRTPLTLINGQLELILHKRDIHPTVYSAVLSAYKSSQRLRRLVDEIIDIRKQEQGFLRLRVYANDICDFTRNIFASFGQLAKSNGITFHLFLPDYPVTVIFDPEQLEKVFYNLLSNAFKYTSPNGTIEWSVTQEGDFVRIAISDNGNGIQPHHLDKIFDRFFQDEEVNNQLGAKGSGIGLSLAKAIVEMHEGTISVSSTPHVRTTFVVELPLSGSFRAPNVTVVNDTTDRTVVRELDAADLPVEIPAGDEVGDKKRASIVIVEDNEAIRSMLAGIFEFAYDVTVAEDGESGIECVKKVQPDIVLSDVMMPGISGTEMCSRLKNDVETSHIPIVLLTARNAVDFIVEGLQTGADDYITKPFNVKLLVARCNNLVESRRRLQHIYRKETESTPRLLTTNRMDLKLLEKAEKIIETHMDNPDFSISEFSSEMGMSRASLFKKIKGLTGQAPNEYIMMQRLKHARKKLTVDPDVTMSQIAYDTGFTSPSYFIKCFRKAFGETPKAYRQRMSG